MAYQPLTLLNESHNVTAYRDEPHEMIAMQAASSDTDRIDNDSWRSQTVPGEDMIRDCRVSRDADSSASSHQGTTDNNDRVENFSRRCSTAEDDCGLQTNTRQPPILGWKRWNAFPRLAASCWRATLDSWFYEGTALTFSVGCLTTLFVVLGLYDGRETPRLPYNITLNALVSVLATAAKSSLIFAVSGTLGQLKWAWFTEAHKLSDLQAFDDATRGPWGAIMLLCSRSIRPLASLGAAITVFALAYDPFLQQLVRYPVVGNSVASREATIQTATSFDATRNFSVWDAARVAGWSNISLFDIDPVCPTGDCIWPQFESLGYCSKCGDTTAETHLNCTAVVATWDGTTNKTCDLKPEKGYPATVWKGREDRTDDFVSSIVWLVRLTSDEEWNLAAFGDFESAPQSAYEAGHSFLGIDDPILVFAYAELGAVSAESPAGKGSRPDPTVLTLKQVETCILTPCLRTYEVSMSAGKLKTVVLNTDYGLSEIREEVDKTLSLGAERCWRTSLDHERDAAPTAVLCEHDGCDGFDTRVGRSFCNRENDQAQSSRVTRSIGLLGMEKPRGIFRPDPMKNDIVDGFPMDAQTGDVIRAHNFTYLIERIAASMTKAERDNSLVFVTGNMTSSVVHVDVAWHWFNLPTTLDVLAVVLLLSTSILGSRRKTVLWKSSALALLYHGFEDLAPIPDHALSRVSEMGQRASVTSATLGSAKDSGRLVLRNVSDGRA